MSDPYRTAADVRTVVRLKLPPRHLGERQSVEIVDGDRLLVVDFVGVVDPNSTSHRGWREVGRYPAE